MALQGNCTHITYEESGETQEVVKINPDGSEETITVNVNNPIETEYTNVYVIVKQVEFFQTYADQMVEGEEESNFVKTQVVIFHLAGYESKQTRDEDQENWLFWEPMELQNYDYNLNVLSQCYNQVKQTEGYTNLTNA